MNLPIILVYSFSILTNSILALVVFLRNPKSIVNRFFALFTLSIVGWISTLFISTFVTSFRLVNLLTRLNFAFILLLAYTLFYFSYYFPKKTFNLSPLLHFAFAVETFGLIILTLLSFEIAGAGRAVSGVMLTIYGKLYSLFVIHFLVYSASSLFILFSKLKKFKGFLKAQIECLLLGLSSALLFGLIMHLLLPWVFRIYNIHLLRPLSTLFFLGFTSYGIIRLRLLDIRLIVARTVAYFLLVFLIALLVASTVYAFGVFVVGRLAEKVQVLIFTILVLFILFAFPTLNKFLRKITDKIFLRGRYDSAVLLRTLSLITASTLSLEDLIKDVLDELLGKMKIYYASVVLVKDSGILKIKPAIEKHASFLEKKEIAELLELVDSQDKILVFDELKEGRVKTILRKLNLMVFVPLRVRRKKVGFLLLGEKSSGEVYSVQDITVLEILAPGLALAIQNALVYDEIRKFNVTLKEEIKKATMQLRRANVKLKELDELKDEFLSIASHELRTPMTAIRGYIDMILSGDAGEINKKVREFLDTTFVITNRLTSLVNDMLDVSRIERKNLSFKINEIDLSRESKRVIGQLASLAKEKKISLSYKTLKKLPLVKADSAKVCQVLNNLIGNAIKFTEKGGVTISHKIENDFVITEVKDTGIGISEENMEKLFQKFSRIDGSLRREKGGTGLGLYISKGLIEGMKGKIWLKSKSGQGTTLGFSLPRVK